MNLKRILGMRAILVFIFSSLIALPAFSYDYIELASEKIFTPGEKVHVTVGSYRAREVGIRVYKLKSPKDYLTGLRNLHYPKVESKRRALNLFQLKANLGKGMQRQWKTFVRGNFNTLMRQDLIKSLALEGSKTIKHHVEKNHDLFPILKTYPLLKKYNYKLKKGKHYYNYTKLSLGIKKKGVYLVEGVYNNKAAYTIVIISNLSFITKTYKGGRLIYVTDRKTGEPVSGAKIELYKNKKLITDGKSDSDGIYQIKSKKGEGNKALIFVQKGKDFALSDPYFYRGYYSRSAGVYIYTSRPVYRPGQKVSFKAIIRDIKNNSYNMPRNGAEVQIKIKDNKRNELYNKYLKLNEFGSVNGEFQLKAGSKLGNYKIEAVYNNANYTYYFKVDKYKKPEYEVKVKTDKKNYVKGDKIRATIKAKYYFGSPVSKGKLEYHVYRTRYFVPWYDTSYGWYYSSSENERYSYSRTQEVKSDYDIKLKADGTTEIVIDTKKINKKYKDRSNYYRYTEPDYKYTIKATVVDQSRRNISGSTSTLVTRSDHYLKISTGKWLYEPNNDIDIRVKAKHFNGKPVKNHKVKLEFYKETWEKKNGKYRYNEKLIGKKTAQTDKRGIIDTSYRVDKGMYLIVKAVSKDRFGNETSDKRYIYVYGGESGREKSGKGTLTIIADKSTYSVGQKAKIVFNSPIKKGYILTTFEANSIPYYKLLKVKNGRASLNVKLKDAYTPNIWVTGSIVFDNKLYEAKKEIIIPPLHKFLKVEVISNKKQYKPGENAEFIIRAKDYKGNPVKSEVSVGIVDSSIYAIASERTQDIRKYFYSKKYNGVSTTSSLYFRFSGDFQDRQLMSLLHNKKNISLASYKEDGDNLKEAKVRKIFKDEIVWLPAVKTNSDGEAKIKFKFPDNLTRWRTTVRVVTKQTFVGSVVHKVVVRKNLLIRMALPRFYREKDKAILSTIVHNYLKSPKTVHISLEAKGLEILNKGVKKVTVATNDEVRIDWEVRASKAGKATILAKALTNEESDAVEKSIPVLPHGLETLDPYVYELRKKRDKFTQTVVFKDNYIQGYTELKINLAPSVIVAMNAALPYLVKEPYGCVEQTMSRFLPLVLVDDIVKKTGYGDVNMASKIATYYKTGVERLYHLQHSDGGWGWWVDDKTHPYMTAYALSGLLLAKKVGRPVKGDVINRGVKSIQFQLKSNKKLELTTKVFMLKALSSAGKKTKKEALKLYKARKKLNPYARGLLTEILVNEKEMIKAQVLMKELVKEAKKDILGVFWTGRGWHYNWQDDSEETTANVVRAIALVDDNQKVISPAVRWIMSQRKESRWRSTKSTAIMIHALYDIAKRRKELSPNYTVNVYLNGKKYHTMRVGRGKESLKSFSFTIPEGDLNKGINIVKVEKNGSGALYYSSAFKYYERSNWFKEKDNGFSVTRKYFRLVKEDDSGEIRYRKIPIRDRVVSGDIILAELTVDVKKGRREYVLIEDQLPSGCEVIKKDRGYTIEGSRRYKGYRSWDQYYYAAREVHDERVGIARTYVWRPKFKIEYLMRAEIPGEYRVMPAKVSLMYYPEVGGRSNELKLRIIDKK